MKKEVHYLKDGKIETREKECIPRALPLSSRYIEKWWFDAIQSVYHWEKQRGLVGRHLLVSDNRIEAGFSLYKNRHIEEATITTEQGGDALLHISSEDKKDKYIVVVKNFLPIDGKIPSYAYQRENFISNLQVSCQCEDFSYGRYKDNSSLCCKHIICSLIYLQDRWEMPRIFFTIEQKMLGVQKSDVEELEINIEGLPLIKFTPHINVLLMKKYRNMLPAISVSLHRVLNDDHTESNKPHWITFTNEQLPEVERLINGISKGYTTMMQAKGMSDKEIDEKLRVLTMRMVKKKSWFDRLRRKT